MLSKIDGMLYAENNLSSPRKKVRLLQSVSDEGHVLGSSQMTSLLIFLRIFLYVNAVEAAVRQILRMAQVTLMAPANAPALPIILQLPVKCD